MVDTAGNDPRRDDDGGDNFSVGFFYNGVELTRDDFGDGLRDYIAFQIAFTASITCLDKTAALELLHVAADSILRKVRAAKKGGPS